MKTAFRASFLRDVKKIKTQSVLSRVRNVIEEVEAAANPNGVRNLKKMAGTVNFYRIRVGEYRVGIAIEGNVVEFVRCLHRRDLYRYFP